jgi:hypothetical protein
MSAPEKKIGNEPAFPIKGKIAVKELSIDPFGDKAKEQVVIRECTMPGLTKREYLAGLAMQACLTHTYESAKWSSAATDAVRLADALLAELEKEEK